MLAAKMDFSTGCQAGVSPDTLLPEPTPMGPLLTDWTIRCSLALYAAVTIGCALRLSSFGRAAKYLWAAGSLLLLAHLAAAFHFYHQWSHLSALQHTAAETRRLLGVPVAAGLYVNYLFAVVWLADSAWWLHRGQQYWDRPRWAQWLVHGFLFFIAFNGAVVFAEGPVRWVGIAVTVALAAALSWRLWRTAEGRAADQQQPDPPESLQAATTPAARPR
jgi:hypothetical protein